MLPETDHFLLNYFDGKRVFLEYHFRPRACYLEFTYMLPEWTTHDLRRTFRTLISVKDIAVPIINEKLLGHKMPKIMTSYDKDEMLPKEEVYYQTQKISF